MTGITDLSGAKPLGFDPSSEESMSSPKENSLETQKGALPAKADLSSLSEMKGSESTSVSDPQHKAAMSPGEKREEVKKNREVKMKEFEEKEETLIREAQPFSQKLTNLENRRKSLTPDQFKGKLVKINDEELVKINDKLGSIEKDLRHVRREMSALKPQLRSDLELLKPKLDSGKDLSKLERANEKKMKKLDRITAELKGLKEKTLDPTELKKIESELNWIEVERIKLSPSKLESIDEAPQEDAFERDSLHSETSSQYAANFETDLQEEQPNVSKEGDAFERDSLHSETSSQYDKSGFEIGLQGEEPKSDARSIHGETLEQPNVSKEGDAFERDSLHSETSSQYDESGFEIGLQGEEPKPDTRSIHGETLEKPKVSEEGDVSKSLVDRISDKITSVLGQIKNSGLGVLLGLGDGVKLCVTKMKEGFASFSKGFSDIKKATVDAKELATDRRELKGAIQKSIDNFKRYIQSSEDGPLSPDEFICKPSYTDKNCENVRKIFDGADVLGINDNQIDDLQKLLSVSGAGGKEKIETQYKFLEQVVFNEFVKLGVEKVQKNPNMDFNEFSSSQLREAVLIRLININLKNVLKSGDREGAIKDISSLKIQEAVSSFFEENGIPTDQKNLSSVIADGSTISVEIGNSFVSPLSDDVYQIGDKKIITGGAGGDWEIDMTFSDLEGKIAVQYRDYAIEKGLSKDQADVFVKRMQGLMRYANSKTESVSNAAGHDVKKYGDKIYHNKLNSTHHEVSIENGRIKCKVYSLEDFTIGGDLDLKIKYKASIEQNYDIDLQQFISIDSEQQDKLPEFSADQAKISTHWKLVPHEE